MESLLILFNRLTKAVAVSLLFTKKCFLLLLMLVVNQSKMQKLFRERERERERKRHFKTS